MTQFLTRIRVLSTTRGIWRFRLRIIRLRVQAQRADGGATRPYRRCRSCEATVNSVITMSPEPSSCRPLNDRSALRSRSPGPIWTMRSSFLTSNSLVEHKNAARTYTSCFPQTPNHRTSTCLETPCVEQQDPRPRSAPVKRCIARRANLLL